MSSGGSSNPAGNTTTTQKADPWSVQQPYLAQGFQQAGNLYNTGGPQYFPGQTYAGPTDAQSTALYDQQNIAGQGSPISPAATNASLNMLSPDYLTSNPGNDLYGNMANGPAMQGAIQSAVSNATPGLLDTFTQGNRLNSPGAAYGVSQGIASAAAPYVLQGQQQAAQGISSNYNTQAQQQNQAQALAPQTQQMPYNDLAQLYNAGATQQGLQQQDINDQMARYNYDQTQPYNLLNWFNQSVGGNYGSTSTLTSPYFQQQTGGLPGGLQGALGGAALGSIFPGIGTAVGAGAGGLLGMLR